MKTILAGNRITAWLLVVYRPSGKRRGEAVGSKGVFLTDKQDKEEKRRKRFKFLSGSFRFSERARYQQLRGYYDGFLPRRQCLCIFAPEIMSHLEIWRRSWPSSPGFGMTHNLI